MDIRVVILVAIFGLIGMWWHWFTNVNIKRGESSSFTAYLFTENRLGSGKTVGALILALVSAYGFGAFDGVDMATAVASLLEWKIDKGLGTLLGSAIGVGYICDSQLNSAK